MRTLSQHILMSLLGVVLCGRCLAIAAHDEGPHVSLPDWSRTNETGSAGLGQVTWPVRFVLWGLAPLAEQLDLQLDELRLHMEVEGEAQPRIFHIREAAEQGVAQTLQDDLGMVAGILRCQLRVVAHLYDNGALPLPLSSVPFTLLPHPNASIGPYVTGSHDAERGHQREPPLQAQQSVAGSTFDPQTTSTDQASERDTVLEHLDWQRRHGDPNDSAAHSNSGKIRSRVRVMTVATKAYSFDPETTLRNVEQMIARALHDKGLGRALANAAGKSDKARPNTDDGDDVGGQREARDARDAVVDVDVVVLPELFAYNPYATLQASAERVRPELRHEGAGAQGAGAAGAPAAVLPHCRAWARRFGCYVVCTLVERAEVQEAQEEEEEDQWDTQRGHRGSDGDGGGAIYNSAVLVGRNGEVVGVYRKTFPTYGSYDEAGVSPSPDARPPVFVTDFGRVAILLCFDINFAELWAHLGLPESRADIVLFPSAMAGSRLLRAYATIHNYYIVENGDQGCFFDVHGSEVPPVFQTSEGVRVAVLHLDRRRVHALHAHGAGRGQMQHGVALAHSRLAGAQPLPLGSQQAHAEAETQQLSEGAGSRFATCKSDAIYTGTRHEYGQLAAEADMHVDMIISASMACQVLSDEAPTATHPPPRPPAHGAPWCAWCRPWPACSHRICGLLFAEQGAACSEQAAPKVEEARDTDAREAVTSLVHFQGGAPCSINGPRLGCMPQPAQSDAGSQEASPLPQHGQAVSGGSDGGQSRNHTLQQLLQLPSEFLWPWSALVGSRQRRTNSHEQQAPLRTPPAEPPSSQSCSACRGGVRCAEEVAEACDTIERFNVTVVLRHSHHPRMLQSQLHALSAQSFPVAQVWVIMSASLEHDNLKHVLARTCDTSSAQSRLRCHQVWPGDGFAGSISLPWQVALQATTKYVWFLDEDVVPGREALQYMLHVANTRPYRHALLGGRGSCAWRGIGSHVQSPSTSRRETDHGWPEDCRCEDLRRVCESASLQGSYFMLQQHVKLLFREEPASRFREPASRVRNWNRAAGGAFVGQGLGMKGVEGEQFLLGMQLEYVLRKYAMSASLILPCHGAPHLCIDGNSSSGSPGSNTRCNHSRVRTDDNSTDDICRLFPHGTAQAGCESVRVKAPLVFAHSRAQAQRMSRLVHSLKEHGAKFVHVAVTGHAGVPGAAEHEMRRVFGFVDVEEEEEEEEEDRCNELEGFYSLQVGHDWERPCVACAPADTLAETLMHMSALLKATAPAAVFVPYTPAAAGCRDAKGENARFAVGGDKETEAAVSGVSMAARYLEIPVVWVKE